MSLTNILAAAQHGAALVYHEIVAIEQDVTKWEAAHPEVGPLIQAGTAFAAQALSQSGLPVPAMITAGTAVLSALKSMAANDPSVTSGGSSSAVPSIAATADSGAVQTGGMRSSFGWMPPRGAVAAFVGLLLSVGVLTGCTTVPALFTDISAAAGTVASLTSGTVSNVASAVSTDATAAADATPDVQSLVSTIEGIVADGTVTPAEQTTVTQALSQLSTIASTVTPTSTGQTVSTALGGIEGVISTLAPIFTDLAPLIALADNTKAHPQFALLAETVQPLPVQHSDPAKIATLKAHLHHLKMVAAAKIAAGK